VRALVLVVDLSSEDPAADLSVLRAELEAYDRALLDRPTLVVGTKADLVDDADERARSIGADVVVSAVTGAGLEELSDPIATLATAAAEATEDRQAYVVLRPGRPRFEVRREGERYRVVGRGVERWVAETDLDDPRQVERLQKRLVKEGVERQLAAAGARRGDEILIGTEMFEFIPEDDRG
jgi:GTP-binding protein